MAQRKCRLRPSIPISQEEPTIKPRKSFSAPPETAAASCGGTRRRSRPHPRRPRRLHALRPAQGPQHQSTSLRRPTPPPA